MLPPDLLPCPECRAAGQGGTARIGNRRKHCGTCNNFAANVTRITSRRLRLRHTDEYNQIRATVETDLWPHAVETYLQRAGI